MIDPDNLTGSTATQRHVLGAHQPFPESVLWELQAQYFEKRGIDAWRCGEVPHYVTGNPLIANAYAQIAWAFMQDRQLLGKSSGDPITFCELGAGSGAFAFHFISRMIALCKQAGEAPSVVFRYILTDAANANLKAWRRHPCFAGWFEEGLLDLAHIDVKKNSEMILQVSGERLNTSMLCEPLVVIANYLFDSIPQDLYYISKGNSQRCLLSLTLDHDPDSLNETQQLENAKCCYDYERSVTSIYTEPALAALVEYYKSTLNETHVTVPSVGWQAIERLRTLSSAGMLLLAADKGDAILSSLDYQPPPEIQRHGSVSVPVNIHALRWLTEWCGGLSLAPEDTQRDFIIFALLHAPQAKDYTNTRLAYEHQVKEYPPFDFYRISEHIKNMADSMSVSDILAYVRLSRYDSQQFAFFLPHLIANAASFKLHEQTVIIEMIEKVWKTYFPLGEELDLAYHLACLLYEMGRYQEALCYFQYSLEIYGAHTGTYYNMSACYQLLGDAEQAQLLLRKILQTDPDNVEAKTLLNQLSQQQDRG